METTRAVIDTSKNKLEAKSVKQLRRLLDEVLSERMGLDPSSPDYAQSLEAEGRLRATLKVVLDIERGMTL